MQMETATKLSIVDRYRAKTPKSGALYERARAAFPSGLTHDSRVLDPYPLFVERAAGPRKWCVDGHEYVDYFGGHGALLLGHCAPEVVAAVQRQVTIGTHFGSAHELELRWAELIQALVPGAERVRFTASGTEATHLALRLARAFTGKDKVVRFLGHFHGWHDHVAAGSNSHYDGTRPIGVLPDIVEATILMPTDDVQRTVSLLDSRDDIAAVIIEPSGASWGQVPLPPGFLQALREATARRGVVLIFDEVISGFRFSPGGAQQAFGITADLCTMAKIVAGGLPGGALAGRRDIMEGLDFAATKAAGRERVAHQGTYNANPLSAAAGIATLETRRRHGRLRARKRCDGKAACRDERGARSRGRAVGGLRRPLVVPRLHQSQRPAPSMPSASIRCGSDSTVSSATSPQRWPTSCAWRCWSPVWTSWAHRVESYPPRTAIARSNRPSTRSGRRCGW